MTAADLAPIIDFLMTQNLLLVLIMVFCLLTFVITLFRFLIVVKRSVKGRMDRVQ